MNTIKLLIMDVDGTLADGRIHIGRQGEMMKAFDVRDGYSIVQTTVGSDPNVVNLLST